MFREFPLLDKLPVDHRVKKVKNFIGLLKDNQEHLILKSSQSTRTPIRYHIEDLNYSCEVISYLFQNMTAHENIKFRPKGKILIGLSANEPLVVGIIPLIAALLAGNNVIVRAASVNRLIMEDIINLLYKSGFKSDEIYLVPQNRGIVHEEIQKSDFVFWFGSSKTSKEIASSCLELGVPYDYEAAGYDLAILDNTLCDEEIQKIVKVIGESITRHDGQICQAVRGVLIHTDIMEYFKKAVSKFVNSLTVGNYLDPKVECTAFPQIFYVEKPVFDSSFSAQMWCSTYTDSNKLLDSISYNPYRLTLNIYSNVANEVIFKQSSYYKTARLLINYHPAHVAPNEPWGGIGLSGTTGPMPWLEKFVDKTFVRIGELCKLN